MNYLTSYLEMRSGTVSEVGSGGSTIICCSGGTEVTGGSWDLAAAASFPISYLTSVKGTSVSSVSYLTSKSGLEVGSASGKMSRREEVWVTGGIAQWQVEVGIHFQQMLIYQSCFYEV